MDPDYEPVEDSESQSESPIPDSEDSQLDAPPTPGSSDDRDDLFARVVDLVESKHELVRQHVSSFVTELAMKGLLFSLPDKEQVELIRDLVDSIQDVVVNWLESQPQLALSYLPQEPLQ